MKKRKVSVLSVFRPAPCGKWNLFFRVKWFFQCLKNAWDRATRGYCIWDVYNLTEFYPCVIGDTLNAFSKNLKSVPYQFYDESAPDPSYSWESYLQSIVHHIIAYNDYTKRGESLFDGSAESSCGQIELVNGELVLTRNAQEAFQKLSNEQLRLHNLAQKEIETAFAKLAKVFPDLWD